MSGSVKHETFKQWKGAESEAELMCPLKANFPKFVSAQGLMLRRTLSPTTMHTWGPLWHIWKNP